MKPTVAMMLLRSALVFLGCFLEFFQLEALDLSRAVVVSPPELSGPDKKAVTMLVEEVEKRTGIRWGTNPIRFEGAKIVIGSISNLKGILGGDLSKFVPDGDLQVREGYHIRVRPDPSAPTVYVIGNDSRGVLFGVGHLLRSLKMNKDSVSLDDYFQVSTAPKYPLRGHQLGYRP
jgi:alpha-glucuronidase